MCAFCVACLLVADISLFANKPASQRAHAHVIKNTRAHPQQQQQQQQHTTTTHRGEDEPRDERHARDEQRGLHVHELGEAGAHDDHRHLQRQHLEVGLGRGGGEDVARHRVEVAVAHRL